MAHVRKHGANALAFADLLDVGRREAAATQLPLEARKFRLQVLFVSASLIEPFQIET
jgi:hypothetical protein